MIVGYNENDEAARRAAGVTVAATAWRGRQKVLVSPPVAGRQAGSMRKEVIQWTAVDV